MARHKITAASDLFFHQKILNKYRKNKKNYIKFPMMIFLKNLGYFLTKKINLDFLFKLSFHSHSMFASIGSEINLIRNFREAYKNISMQYKTSLQDPASNIEVNSFMKSVNFKLEKVALAFDKILQILFSFNYVKVNNQPQNYFNQFQTASILARGFINDTERKSGINADPMKENRIPFHLSFKQGSPAFHSYYFLRFKPQNSSSITYYIPASRNILLTKEEYYPFKNKDISHIISFQIKGVTEGKIFNNFSSQKDKIFRSFEFKSKDILFKDSLLKANTILLHSTFYQPDRYYPQRLHYTYILQGVKPLVRKTVLNEFHSSFDPKSREIISNFNSFQINNTFRNNILSHRVYGFSFIGGSQKQDFLNRSNISQFISAQTHKISFNIISSKAPTSSSYQTIFTNHSMFELKSPVIFLKNNSLTNNRTLRYKGENLLNEAVQTSSIYNKPVKPDFSNGSEAIGFKEIRQNNIFKDHDNFFFKNNQKIEQKIEQVKRIAEEVKNTVTQKSISSQASENAVDRQIDINRISDQVYQMIDQRIKIEKERRGYL